MSSMLTKAVSKSMAAKPGDFTADHRTLILAIMAVAVGAGGAGSAWLLIKLIALVTNLAWFGTLSVANMSPSEATRGPWMVLVPAG